jgi:penicillin-binding protein A
MIAQSKTVTPEYKHGTDRSITLSAVNRMSPEVERRRRLVTRTLPLAIIALIAFVVGAATGAPGSPEKEAAERFAEAWSEDRFAAMYKELNPASQAAISVNDFAIAYREAENVATLRELDPGSAHDPESDGGTTIVNVPMLSRTVAFGEREDELSLPYDDGGIAWEPSLVYPGLRSGEQLESEIELAPRAPILASDGTPLAEGPVEAREHPLGTSAIDITGEVGEPAEEEVEELARQGFPPATPVGISGLERAFNARLAGKPGGELLAVAATGGDGRILASSKPKAGAPVKTTIDPDLQEAAVVALAGRSGGVAVLDTRNGDVRALAGQAFSAPQPPGSTFKIITTTAAL